MTVVFAPQTLFFTSLLFFAVGAAGALLLRKNDAAANAWGNLFAIFGGVAGLVASFSVMISGSVFSFTVDSSLPLLSFSFAVDRLSAFFIFILSLIALLASVYAMGYVRHFYKKYSIGALGFFYNIFLAGMMMVFAAHQAIFFLVVWEIMSLASYFLVVFEHKQRENVKAGTLYFVMTHVGTIFITLVFLLFFHFTGSFDFDIVKAHAGSIPPFFQNIIFILALIGFGTKAGIIPLHIWLPAAHPAAPTHVSALMSGVMIKTGIYMLIRIFLDLLPSAPLWLGIVVLMLGSASALLGVLYALTEHDIKRLLAYHSIENIGIILLGFGSALVFLSLGMRSLAILGLIASLFHTLNHAIFKALLFFGAGAVLSKTHTRNMEEYGGLIKYMPQTAFFFLIGSLAISALPPFNGFASEWMTFQSLFSGIRSFGPSVQWAFIIAAGSLAFTGGLAAACFVKAFGATFLARPRSAAACHVTESGMTLRLSMAVLATLTLVFGIFSGSVAHTLTLVVTGLDAFASSVIPFSSSLRLFSLRDGFASLSVPSLFIGLVGGIFGVWCVVALLTRNRKVSIGRTWDCGTDLTPRMEITATGFSRSIVTMLRGILKPTQQTQVEYRDADMRYFPKTSTVKLAMQDLYSTYFYVPLQELVTKIAEYVKRIQSGNVNVYVLYTFSILLLLLVVLVW